MKTALICLEKLDIGGVETFTITQVKEFAKRNIKCYVMAQEGILSEHIKKEKNIEFIEFNFELKNEIDYNKVSYLEKFIKEKNIEFIYVHQFSCVPYILPIVHKLKIPYIAYLHNIVPKTCEWFMDTYEIFKLLFPIYFECASKIIAITNKVKEEHQNLFNLPEEKYKVINNSLDFSQFPNRKLGKINLNYTNLILFGRVSEQKRYSIYTAVKFYKYYKENYNKNAKLTIIGDGEIYEEIVEKYKSTDIVFKGAVSNIIDEIKKADILLGVDRCMLEAVALKKPAIICGYNKNIALVTPNNLKDAIEENFTGKNLGDNKDELFKYNEKEIKNILNNNYEYIKKNLSICDCIYLDIKPFVNCANIEKVLLTSNYYIKLIDKLKQENKQLFLKTQELYAIIDKYPENNESIFKKLFNNLLKRGGKNDRL